MNDHYDQKDLLMTEDYSETLLSIIAFFFFVGLLAFELYLAI